MGKERITMTKEEQHRAQVLMRLLAGQYRQTEAAQVLGLSVRQVRRLAAGYEAGGPAALVHGNRGRVSAQRIPDAVRAQVVALARGRYAGFNHQHLTEKLATEGIVLGRTTLRRILAEASVASPRPRRPAKHRRRRERMAQEGMLLQADGSRHRWLGPDGPYLTLIGAIDDATGTVPWAVFREQEDAAGYLEVLRMVVQTKGIPLALYVDRHGIFERHPRKPLTLEEELAGGRLPTQVGRVLGELGIRHIAARSPQAKGRVERLWGTCQDRLVSELRLAGAQRLADANRVLRDFLPGFNARFAGPPAQPGSAYRPLPAGFVPEQVFCFKYTRVVAADNTVRFGPRRLHPAPAPGRATATCGRDSAGRARTSAITAGAGSPMAAVIPPAEDKVAGHLTGHFHWPPTVGEHRIRRHPSPSPPVPDICQCGPTAATHSAAAPAGGRSARSSSRSPSGHRVGWQRARRAGRRQRQHDGSAGLYRVVDVVGLGRSDTPGMIRCQARRPVPRARRRAPGSRG
jgi:hypothetical protein